MAFDILPEVDGKENFDGSINTDDGRMNFDSGDMFSAVSKMTSMFSFRQTAAGQTLFRVNAFYDAVLDDDESLSARKPCKRFLDTAALWLI